MHPLLFLLLLKTSLLTTTTATPITAPAATSIAGLETVIPLKGQGSAESNIATNDAGSGITSVVTELAVVGERYVSLSELV